MKSFTWRWRRKLSGAAQLTLLFFSLVERKQPATVSFKVRCHPRAAAAAADESSEFWLLAPIRMQLCFLSSGLGLPSWTDGGKVQPVRGSSHEIKHKVCSYWKIRNEFKVLSDERG